MFLWKWITTLFALWKLIRQKRDSGYFDDLKANSSKVPNSVTFETKFNENFIICLTKGWAAITAGTMHGRIWLFGFDPYFLQHPPKELACRAKTQMGVLRLFLMARWSCQRLRASWRWGDCAGLARQRGRLERKSGGAQALWLIFWVSVINTQKNGEKEEKQREMWS